MAFIAGTIADELDAPKAADHSMTQRICAAAEALKGDARKPQTLLRSPLVSQRPVQNRSWLFALSRDFLQKVRQSLTTEATLSRVSEMETPLDLNGLEGQRDRALTNDR